MSALFEPDVRISSKAPVRGEHVTSPASFIRHLAMQSQVLACLRWFGELQVLAFIPAQGSVSIDELADLVGVSKIQLSRVIRITSKAGFLQEIGPNDVAHSLLSARFLSDLVFFDATMFLAVTASPAALEMSTITEQGAEQETDRLTDPQSVPPLIQFPENVKVRRQWKAFQRCAWDCPDTIIDVVSQLKWHNLGSASVVDVSADSTEIACVLVQINPSLKLIVQTPDPTHTVRASFDGRVTVQHRLPAASQTITNAVAYVYRPTHSFTPSRKEILGELEAHRNVLKADPAASMILIMPLIPSSGTLSPELEADVRLRDLYHFQLTGRAGMTLFELLSIVESASDDHGRFTVMNQLWSDKSATVALGLKYQACTEESLEA